MGKFIYLANIIAADVDFYNIEEVLFQEVTITSCVHSTANIDFLK